MLKLRQLEQDILAKGKVGAGELAMLRRQLYHDDRIDRQKIDFLVELHKRVQHRTPAFEHFFYQAIKDHVLTDGRIDGEETAWLRRIVYTDDQIKDEERRLLHELKGEAKQVSHEFDVFFAECMKEPQERHTCG